MRQNKHKILAKTKNMSKKLHNPRWESVALDGFSASMTDNLQGFVGLEECTDYSFEKEGKRSKKKKQNEKKMHKNEKKKRKSLENETKEVPSKKVKLINGFLVESCNSVTPSLTNSVEENAKLKNMQSKRNTNKPDLQTDKKKKNNKKKKGAATTDSTPTVAKKIKQKLGDLPQSTSELTPEDMLTWAEFKLQEPIMKALTELGYKQPTKIQQLTLPAAIHGRRDILGAAETGSGKTLAFGLPIISGILKLKEKAQLKGLDVYDIPYKKSSLKKKKSDIKDDKNEKLSSKNKNRFNGKNQNKEILSNKNENIQEIKVKESSEDGYSSGDDGNSEGDQNDTKSDNNSSSATNPSSDSYPLFKSIPKDSKIDYIEEYDVPYKKRKAPSEDENDSEDSDNFIHLSDMLDSDDLAETSEDEETNTESESAIEMKDDEEYNKHSCSENNGLDGPGNIDDDNVEDSDNEEDSQSEVDEDDYDEQDSQSTDDDSEENEELDNQDVDDSAVEDTDGNNSEEENDHDSDEENDLNNDGTEEGDQDQQGIGCVKVMDDVEIPGYMVTKTGKPLYALILTPTRELAIQISRHLNAAAKYTGIKVATIIGGMAEVKQERLLRAGPEIVVATPGRLWELIGQGQPHLNQLNSVKFLAIDETDRMVERNHFEELHPLLERLNADDDRRAARQNFVFSATLTMVHDLPTHMKGKKVTQRGKILNRKIHKMTPQQKVDRLIKMIGMSDPKVVDITTQNLGTAETLTESRIACELEHKDAYLYYIVKRHPGRTIVFCNSIGSVKRLAQLFTSLQCRPLPLHASMPQRQRLKNLERFRDDPHGVLIATDVAARGLDIPHVEHVIHYQVPRTAENYVHRSGRTARATREGLTILMMEPSEAYLYAKLCRTLNKTSEVPTFPVDAQILSPLKELVALARDLDALELKKRRAAQSQGWRERAAREMDMIIDDDDLPVKQVDASIEKALKAKRRQLENMLTQPIYPRGFSFKYPTLNNATAFGGSEENALQVMKKALQSGQQKKEKRKGKNAPLLQLQKKFKK